MADTTANTGGRFVYCADCGSEIREKAEICPECGVRQKDPYETARQDDVYETHDDGSLTDHYSTVVWIASAFVGLLGFPIGLIIPLYFYIKASNGTGREQSGFETWTVVFLGLFGIAAVEIGGKKGAKILWGIVGGLLALAVLGVFALALG